MSTINNYLVVVDLGGTKILSAVLDQQGEIISLAKKPTRSESKNEAISDRIISVVEESILNASLSLDHIDGIVLGIPGSLNPETKIVNLAPNLGWKNYDVTKNLQNHFNKEILIENDANLGTLGIYHFEMKERCKNLIAIFVGTGIGAGIIIDRKIYRGKNFSAGEIGHIIINENGVKCGCGKYGCLETEASRTAITRLINENIKMGKKTIITKLSGNTNIIKSKTLKEAVKKKDKVTIKAIEYAAEKLGLIAGNMINMFDFDCIVFAGGVMEALGGYMLPIIKKRAKETALKSNIKNTKITLSSLKDYAALFGGYVLFKKF